MRLLYFAWVKEKTGVAAEDVTLPDSVATVAELISWLKTRGPEFANAFEQSEAFAVLEADPAVATYMSVTEALGEDQFGVDKDEVLDVAIGCWQTEDAKINAALKGARA